MKKSHLSLAAAAAAIILFAALYLTDFQSNDPHPSAIVTRSATSTMPPAGASSNHVSVDHVDSVPDVGISPAAASSLETARDYRVLFEGLLQSGEEKAGLYAMHILKVCSNMRQAPLVAPSVSTRQDVARDLLAARCASFSSDEISDARRRQLLSDPRLQGGLKDLVVAWYGAGLDPAKRKSSLGAILSSGDALLMEQVGPLLFYRHDTEKFNFAGQVYPVEFGQLIVNSWNAAVCEATTTLCGPSDPYVVEACAQTTICSTTRRHWVESQIRLDYGAEGAALFDRIYPQMVDAIKKRDTSVFLD